jgi:hypothetical protein
MLHALFVVCVDQYIFCFEKSKMLVQGEMPISLNMILYFIFSSFPKAPRTIFVRIVFRFALCWSTVRLLKNMVS